MQTRAFFQTRVSGFRVCHQFNMPSLWDGIVGFFPVTWISLYKIYTKPKVNFASTSVGKTQSGCLLSVTGYQYAYRYILLFDLKTKHYNAISILYRYSHIQR